MWAVALVTSIINVTSYDMETFSDRRSVQEFFKLCVHTPHTHLWHTTYIPTLAYYRLALFLRAIIGDLCLPTQHAMNKNSSGKHPKKPLNREKNKPVL